MYLRYKTDFRIIIHSKITYASQHISQNMNTENREAVDPIDDTLLLVLKENLIIFKSVLCCILVMNTIVSY